MKRTDSIQWDPANSAAENARAFLPALADELFEAGRAAVTGKVKAKSLHQFRLRLKRFRYTLEIFRPLYGPAMNDRLAKLRQIQQRLGEINDFEATGALLKRTASSKRGKMPEVLAWLKARRAEGITEFVRLWQAEFDAPGEREQWARYLRLYAGRTRGPA